jgi:chromosome segregation ATPase
MVAAIWEAFCAVIAWIFRKPKERIEPVIEGYDGLVDGQQGFIDTLNASIEALNRSIAALQHEQVEGIRLRKRLSKRLGKANAAIKHLTQEVRDCNEHRQELEKRVRILEALSPNI